MFGIVGFVREQTTHWICEMWTDKSEIHAARKWKIFSEKLKMILTIFFCLDWIHRLPFVKGICRWTKVLLVLPSMTIERYHLHPVWTKLKHYVVAIMSENSSKNTLTPTRTLTHVASFRWIYFDMSNSELECIAVLNILEIEIHPCMLCECVRVFVYICSPLATAPNECVAQPPPIQVHSVHPNRVFTQHKSSNAECFFLNPSTAKKQLRQHQEWMRKRETKKCVFCVLDFRRVFLFCSSSFYLGEEPWIRDAPWP